MLNSGGYDSLEWALVALIRLRFHNMLDGPRNSFYSIMRAFFRNGYEWSGHPSRLLLKFRCNCEDCGGEKLSLLRNRFTADGQCPWDSLQKEVSLWLTFLSNLGIFAETVTHSANLLWLNLILHVEELSGDPNVLQHGYEIARLFLLLTQLGLDASVRDPESGSQPLHFLLSVSRTAENPPMVIEIAYILIRFGGADVGATNFKGLTPMDIAYGRGWLDEFVSALKMCIHYGSEDLRKRIGLQLGLLEDWGESTALDWENVISEEPENITRRTAALGDRLDY